MPLSLVGAFFIMQAFGYSINLLTLLALVLAIGLVVDDAIIVVENVDRHLKAGAPPLQAALEAARELGGPIIAMTIVLVAAYVPIGLQGGLTGALFTQFAFTLAGAVTVSAVIALTLSPMMCSRVFTSEQEEGRFTHFLDRTFNRLRDAYSRTLSSWLTTWSVVVVFGALILPGVVYLFMTSKAELAPQEDQGIVLEATTGPPDATLTQMQAYSDAEFAIAKKFPEYQQMFQLTGAPTVNQGFGGVLFAPWEQRHRGAAELRRFFTLLFSNGGGLGLEHCAMADGGASCALESVLTTWGHTRRPLQAAAAVYERADTGLLAEVRMYDDVEYSLPGD
jgi:multidrug efflux pump